MWNVLLDELPDEWNGYPIDSDFQTGILISQCLNDDTLSYNEKFYTAARLLFTDKIPSNEEVAEAIEWYMNEYNHDNSKRKKNEVIVMDFDIDQWRIYAAFLNQYQIDLNRERVHWFVFMGLLANLNECTFSNVMNIRDKKITDKMSIEEKEAIKKMQRVFQIKPPKEEPVSVEEQKRIDEFMKYSGTKRKPKD